MMPRLTYRDCQAAELHRQQLLQEAAQARLVATAEAAGPRFTSIAATRYHLGRLLVLAGEALQGTLAAGPTVPSSPVSPTLRTAR